MQYVLWLEWRNFYCDADVKHPQIVVRNKTVLDLNSEARSRGIRLGMPFALARNIIPDCDVKQWQAADRAHEMEQWLKWCAPYAGRIEPVDQHIAALDLSQHRRPDEIAEQAIERMMKSSTLPLRYGSGPTKWIARLASRHLELSIATERPRDFLAPFPIKALAPVSAEHRERLLFLGYSTIGEVAALPVKVLQDQFPQDGLLIARAAQGRAGEGVEPLYPPDSISEVFRFDGPVQDFQIAERALMPMAERMGERLSGKQALVLDLSLDIDEHPPLSISHALKHPVYDRPSVFTAMIRLWRQLLAKVANPILGLWAKLLQLEPAHSLQNRLFESRRSNGDVSAVNALRLAYGENAITLAGNMRISRREQVLQAWKDATGWT